MAGAFTDDQRRMVAGRARTLTERLADPDALVTGDRGTDTFDAWRDLFPDEASFERRLARAGATREACRQACAAVALAPDEPLPDWIRPVEDLAASVRASDPGSSASERGPTVTTQWTGTPTNTGANYRSANSRPPWPRSHGVDSRRNPGASSRKPP